MRWCIGLDAGEAALRQTPDSPTASFTTVGFDIVPGPVIAAKQCPANDNCYRRARGLLLCIMCVWVVLAACPGSAAQSGTEASAGQVSAAGEGQSLASYEGQNVSSIEIAGRPDYNASGCASCLVQRTGQAFSEKNVELTANALKTADKADRVDIRVEPEASGVRIIFVLQPAVYFGIFQFPGAKRFPYSQLIQAANYPIQEAFSPSEVERDRQQLLTFYRQAGNFRAEVNPRFDVDQKNAIVNVQFDSTLGEHAKFGSVAVEDAPDSEGPELEHKATTLWARLRGAAIRPGKAYHRSTLTRATKYLQGSLEKKGYLGAQVKLSGAQYNEATNRADVHFNANAGPMTRVQIEGAHLWPWTRKSLLPIYQGVGVDDETVTEGRLALISYFQSKGFFDVTVESNLTTEAKVDTVIYKIAKKKRHKVVGVYVAGNVILPSSQLTPQLKVEKKHFLSPGKFSDELVQSSAKNLKAVYQSEGFQDVQVTPQVKRADSNVNVTFRVVEGPRDIVGSLTIEGANSFPQSQFAPKGLKIGAGQPYSQANVQADRQNIIANYLKAGYLIANFRETASQVSKTERHRINVVYHIFEGPRVTTGNVLTLGREHAQQRLIDGDVTDIKKGQPLTESELLSAGSNLYSHTGVFDWAEVDPKAPVRAQNAATAENQDDVLVKVHESKRNSFTYGFGFEVIERGGSIPTGTVALPNLPPIGLPKNFTTSEATFYGPRGTFEYTRSDLFGKGESLSLTGFAGRLDQRGAAYYIDPNFRWTQWKATTSVSVERNEENPIFSSQEEQATLQFQHGLGSANKTIFFAQYGYSQVALTRLLIPSLVPVQDQHVRLSTLSANVTRDTRDNPLDEHDGALDSLQLDFSASKLGSSVNFAKLNAQAAIYREKFHHIVWANSIRIGLAQPLFNSFVPLSEAFFSGGGNSLRGFPLDSAGPQRKIEACSSGSSSSCTLIQVPNGGNELLIVNSEARIPLPIKKGLRLAVFYDGGNVFPSVGFHDFTQLYSNNVGLGLRYSTPIGPIRLDIGRNLNPVPGVGATQYFVGIGQAF
jgi:outer membrane protein assembly factor BamA